MRRGRGAGLEASFRPRLHWGAEFLADRVRLCALSSAVAASVAPDGTGEAGPDAAVAETFEGPWAEAEAFARARGLAHEGLHAAVSHLPFKLEALGPASGEEDMAALAERCKPAGLAADAVEALAFGPDAARCLLLLREDALRAFLERLPEPLAALWVLVPSPLAALPGFSATVRTDAGAARGSASGAAASAGAGRGTASGAAASAGAAQESAPSGRMAALLPEEGSTHVTFLRDGLPEGYVRAFAGLAEARRDPAGYAREIRKALVYHYGAKSAGAALDAFALQADGEAGEAAAALASLGIPRRDLPLDPPLAAVPSAFRAAASLALLGLRGEEPPVTLPAPAPEVPRQRRMWLRRAGLLARAGRQVLAVAAVAAVLLAAAALGFRAVVESKARTWSGELAKWDRFQERRTEAEGRLAGLQGLLDRRSGVYASLQGIAALLPPEVWLSEWESEVGAGAGEGTRYQHRLTGYSLTEAGVPRFLAALEGAGRFPSVKLKSTERVKGEKVEKETGIQANRRDLVRFQAVVTE